MLDEKSFRELFYDAFQIHRSLYRISDNRIVEANNAIQDEYAPKKWCAGRDSKPLNFDDPAYRCCYLHKYAACNASLVHYVLQQRIDTSVFQDLFTGGLVANICCVGGGPGTDVIGLTVFFCSVPEFCDKVFHFSIVDCMLGWQNAYESVLAAASSKYGSFGEFLESRVSSTYLQADMLSCITTPVREAISSADLVTMVKFVSAASSEATPSMVKDVFTMMKPGAAVLFIDYAGGDYYELVSSVAYTCRLTNLCGPFRHLKYSNKAFMRQMLGVLGISSTTVAVQMWQKTFPLSSRIHKSPFTSEQLLDSKTSNFSGSSLGSSSCVDCKQINQKNLTRISENLTTTTVSDAKAKSHERSLGSNEKASSSTDNPVTNITRITVNSSHLKTAISKKTIDSTSIARLKSSHINSINKNNSATTSMSCNQTPVIKKSIESPTIVQQSKSPTIVQQSTSPTTVQQSKSPTTVQQSKSPTFSSSAAQHDRRKPVPGEDNIPCHFEGTDSNVHSSRDNRTGISQQPPDCGKPTADTDLRDNGIHHRFPKSDPPARPAHSPNSRGTKRVNQDEQSTCCCVVL